MNRKQVERRRNAPVNITELDRYRAETERVAQDLTQLIDTANAPIFGIDAGGLVNEWNQTAARITGYTKEEVMGRDLVENFITDEYKASVSQVLEDALGGDEAANFEFPLYTKGGDWVQVLLNATTRRDVSGNITGVVGVGQDITEVKRAQMELMQASKLATLGEMATAVAHELNQPLNVIRMAAESTIESIEEEDADEKFLIMKLNRISEQTQRAASIIDHMRVFGRKADEEFEVIDLRETVDQSLGFMSEQLRLREINLIKDYPDDSCFVRGHSVQIEQVVINLLSNARDVLVELVNADTAKEITVSIGVNTVRGVVDLSIADNGGGIRADVIDRIFEPFYTTKQIGKGTGLGLSISYGIVTDMGGNMSAENGDLGAMIKMSFPRVEKSNDGVSG